MKLCDIFPGVYSTSMFTYNNNEASAREPRSERKKHLHEPNKYLKYSSVEKLSKRYVVSSYVGEKGSIMYWSASGLDGKSQSLKRKSSG